MFKLTQLIHKGKQVKELNEIQREKEDIRKKLNEYDYVPTYPLKMMMYPYGDEATWSMMLYKLANDIAMLLYGKMSAEEFNESLIEIYRFTNTTEYFKALGNYFINISEYNETRKPLEERLAELCKKENKLKEKLGIK